MKINPKFKKVAFLAVKEAGKILKRNFKKKNKFKLKKDNTFLTETDIASEKVIRKIINAHFPEHNIFGEEEGGEVGENFTWVIDPLDGTTNFTSSLPFFSVSICLLFKKRPILATVFNPVSKEFYWAEKGKGAFLNNKPIKVNNIVDLSKSNIEFSKGKDLSGGAKNLSKLAPFIRTFRYLGSDNLAICRVALGQIEGFVGAKEPFYDFGAGAHIVEEAGGKITNFNGEKYTTLPQSLVVSNGKIHNQLLKLLQAK